MVNERKRLDSNGGVEAVEIKEATVKDIEAARLSDELIQSRTSWISAPVRLIKEGLGPLELSSESVEGQGIHDPAENRCGRIHQSPKIADRISRRVLARFTPGQARDAVTRSHAAISPARKLSLPAQAKQFQIEIATASSMPGDARSSLIRTSRHSSFASTPGGGPPNHATHRVSAYRARFAEAQALSLPKKFPSAILGVSPSWTKE
jgi:hypothetical protein